MVVVGRENGRRVDVPKMYSPRWMRISLIFGGVPNKANTSQYLSNYTRGKSKNLHGYSIL